MPILFFDIYVSLFFQTQTKILHLFFNTPKLQSSIFKIATPFSKFPPLFLHFSQRTNQIKSQKNWTHIMPMLSFFYGILAPFLSTSTWLPKLQLLSYVKTKIITHTYTSQKSFFWIAKSMFYFKSEKSSGFVSLWITCGSSRTHPLMQHTKWKKNSPHSLNTL